MRNVNTTNVTAVLLSGREIVMMFIEYNSILSKLPWEHHSLVLAAPAATALQSPSSIDSLGFFTNSTDEVGLVGSFAIILLTLLSISCLEIRKTSSAIAFKFRCI